MAFFILNIQTVSAEYEDLITYYAFEHGASGVSENLNFNKKVYPEPEIIESDIKNLVCYFENEPTAFMEYLREHHPECSLFCEVQENKDWLSEWKKGFKPFCLVQQYWVVPSWEKIEDPNITPIFIDPGMAFGTGTHETTQLCSQLVYDLLSKNSISSLVDVGTGTGILAFLASKMGVSRLLATDNDPEAIRVAGENSLINNIQIPLTTCDISDLKETYDVVVANIIDGVLLKMRKDLFLRSNRYFILSGILLENDLDFIQNFTQDLPIKICQRLQKGEWVAYLLEKEQ